MYITNFVIVHILKENIREETWGKTLFFYNLNATFKIRRISYLLTDSLVKPFLKIIKIMKNG